MRIRHLGGVVVVVLIACIACSADSFAAPPPPSPITAADDSAAAVTSIVTQQNAAEHDALKAKFAKLTAAPKPVTDDAYQQAAKKIGLDLGALHTEHQAIVAEKDAKTRDTKMEVMRDKYTPLMLKVVKEAGLDVVAERKKAVQAFKPVVMMSAAPKTAELSVRPPQPPTVSAAPQTAENSVAPARVTAVRELALNAYVATDNPPAPDPPPPPPPPTATIINLNAPFPVRASTSRDLGSAVPGTGYLEIAKGAHFFDMGLESASLGKTFLVRAGQRRVDVVADLADLRWVLFGNALGHMMGVVRVVLYVNGGTDVLCDDGRTLSEFAASGLVNVSDWQRRPQMRLACSFTRPAGAPERTLTAFVRFSAMSVSTGVPADMFSMISGRLSSMRVTINP